jgi:chromosomal replication initiation ATPase DnaA
MTSPSQRTRAEVEQIAAALHVRGLLTTLRRVAKTYNVTIEDVISRSRYRRVVHARDACIVHLYEVYKMSSTEIGALMGMDHTSVLYARDRYYERDNGEGPVKK